MMRLLKTSFASLLFASLFACSEGGGTGEPGTRTVLLSDVDGDGLYATEGCAEPAPPTAPGVGGGTDPGDIPAGDCVVVPGPDDCVFIGVTTSVDPEGVMVEGGETCVQCYDAAGLEVGEPSCSSTIAPDPVVCVSAGEPDGTLVCWECSTPAGEALYTECYEPPTFCELDEQCAEGEICALPPEGGGSGDVPAGGGAAPLYQPQGICVSSSGTEPGAGAAPRDQ